MNKQYCRLNALGYAHERSQRILPRPLEPAAYRLSSAKLCTKDIREIPFSEGSTGQVIERHKPILMTF
jgi:hypothetical protein